MAMTVDSDEDLEREFMEVYREIGLSPLRGFCHLCTGGHTQTQDSLHAFS